MIPTYSVNMKAAALRLDEKTSEAWLTSEYLRTEVIRDARLLSASLDKHVTIESHEGKQLAVIGHSNRF